MQTILNRFYSTGCFRFGVSPRGTNFPSESASNLKECREKCIQDSGKCQLFHWNHATKACQLIYEDPTELFIDHESLIGAVDCNDVSQLWKANPVTPTIPSTPPSNIEGSISEGQNTRSTSTGTNSTAKDSP